MANEEWISSDTFQTYAKGALNAPASVATRI